MTVQYCDRCGKDITTITSCVAHGIADADEDGNGAVSHAWDLCPACYKWWVTMMNGMAEALKRALTTAKHGRH